MGRAYPKEPQPVLPTPADAGKRDYGKTATKGGYGTKKGGRKG